MNRTNYCGWHNVHIMLQHERRDTLDAELSQIMDSLQLNAWRESWIKDGDVWQVTVNGKGNEDV